MEKILHWILQNILDVGGTIVTVILFFTTNSIKRKVQRVFKFKDYKKDQKGLYNDLKSTMDLIIATPANINPQDIRDLSIILRRIEDYKLNMSRGDKSALRRVKKIVKKGITPNNISEFINLLGTLLGFLSTRSELDIRSI